MTTLVRYVLARDLPEAVRIMARYLTIKIGEEVALFETPEEAQRTLDTMRASPVLKGFPFWQEARVKQVTIILSDYETKEAAPCPSNDYLK